MTYSARTHRPQDRQMEPSASYVSLLACSIARSAISTLRNGTTEAGRGKRSWRSLPMPLSRHHSEPFLSRFSLSFSQCNKSTAVNANPTIQPSDTTSNSPCVRNRTEQVAAGQVFHLSSTSYRASRVLVNDHLPIRGCERTHVPVIHFQYALGRRSPALGFGPTPARGQHPTARVYRTPVCCPTPFIAAPRREGFLAVRHAMTLAAPAWRGPFCSGGAA